MLTADGPLSELYNNRVSEEKPTKKHDELGGTVYLYSPAGFFADIELE